MIDIQEQKRETLGYLDSIITMLEQFKGILSKQPKDMALSVGVVETDAFAYLFDILKSLNGNTEEILEWIVNLLEKATPVMEIAVKAMLLANIKTEISCGSDPTIPNSLREFYYESEYALYRNTYFRKNLQANYPEVKTMLLSSVKFGEGMRINAASLDFLSKLSHNPCGRGGDLLYFGIKEGQSPYSLCRADDMDAFIWFVMNKAKFYSAYPIKTGLDKDGNEVFAMDMFKQHTNSQNLHSVRDDEKIDLTEDNFSLLDFFYASNDDKTNMKNVACGTVLKYEDSNMLSMCTKIRAKNGNTNFAQFFPVSDSHNGAMWYVDSFCYSGKDLIWYSQSDNEKAAHDRLYNDLLVEEQSEEAVKEDTEDKNQSYVHPREYEKEFPIFKLEYAGITSGMNSRPSFGADPLYYGAANSKNNSDLIFKILPKSFIHYPCMNKDCMQFFPFKKILFNSLGEPDKKGHYSVYIDASFSNSYEHEIVPEETAVDGVKMQIKSNYEIDADRHEILYHVLTGKQFNNGGGNDFAGYLVVSKNGDYHLEMNEGYDPMSVLYACYEPSTIYQFNYQYVMGLQLFNAKQLVCSVLDYTLGLNPYMDLNIGITEKQGMDKMRIIEIIKSMCEVDSSSVSDCFYSFSNRKYESMLKKSDLLRHGGYKFEGGDNKAYKVSTEDILSAIKDYDEASTLNERTNVLKRAITEANVAITVTKDTPDTVNPSIGININFLKEIVQNITISMVESLITPKVVMLFKVNRQLMGDYSEYYSVEDFLRANEQIIVGLVKYIRDMILEELIAFVLERLRALIALFSSYILEEYYEKIKRIIKLLKDDWKLCIPSWTKQRVLDTDLPIVNYADIDNTRVPVTEHCD